MAEENDFQCSPDDPICRMEKKLKKMNDRSQEIDKYIALKVKDSFPMKPGLKKGREFHVCISKFSAFYLKKIFEITFYVDPHIFDPVCLFHPDGLIIFKFIIYTFQNHFKQKLKEIDSSFENFSFEYIIFDFTFDGSEANITEKYYKYFPPKNVLFFIICLNLKKKIKTQFKNLLLPHNVVVINLSFFSELVFPEGTNTSYYKKIFDEICFNKNDPTILKEISEKIDINLFKTKKLMEDLNCQNLSLIFLHKTKKNLLLNSKIINIKQYIEEITKELKLKSECKDLALKIINTANKLNLISFHRNIAGYICSAIYLSAVFLLQKDINYSKVLDFFTFNSTSLSTRVKELMGEDEILFPLLFKTTIDKVLDILDVNLDKYTDLINTIIQFIHRKIFSSGESPVYTALAVIYLILNFKKPVSRRKFCKSIKCDRNSLQKTLYKFMDYEDYFIDLEIDLNDPVKNGIEKRILQLLREKGALTTNELNSKMGFDVRRHLNDLLNDNIIEKDVEFVGRTKTAFWKLKGTELDIDLYDPLRKRVLQIFRKYFELTTSEVANMLNLDSKKMYKYLTKLEDEKLLEKRVKREGETFRAYWKLKEEKP